MRQYLLIAAILLSASPALAQSYQQYQPQQEANVTNYPVPPTTYPQVYVPPPQPVQQQPAPGYYDARPTDSGQSLESDFRQMNF